MVPLSRIVGPLIVAPSRSQHDRPQPAAHEMGAAPRHAFGCCADQAMAGRSQSPKSPQHRRASSKRAPNSERRLRTAAVAAPVVLAPELHFLRTQLEGWRAREERKDREQKRKDRGGSPWGEYIQHFFS